ncbi:PD-(D/E)XK nuclease family protein [Sphingomonas sp. I4]
MRADLPWPRVSGCGSRRWRGSVRGASVAGALGGRTRPAGRLHPADRPAPKPPAALRPTTISVTEVDRLKADPYAFYARRVLRLSPLDPVDADPSAAWRGTAVHDILEMWWKEDRCDVEALRPVRWRCCATRIPIR